MKRILSALVLAAMLMLTLAACGGGNSSTTVSDIPTSSAPSATSDAGAASSGSETNTPASSASSTTTGAGDASGESDAGTLERGLWEDGVYTSDFAGIRFTLPEGWLSASDEEIASLMGLGTELMVEGGQPITQELVELRTLTDMMASNPAIGTNVIITFENMGLVPGGSQIDATGYLEIVSQQVDGMTAGGITYSMGDITTEMLGQKEYAAMSAEMLVEAANSTMRQYYYAERVGNYIVLIVLSGADEADITLAQSSFS